MAGAINRMRNRLLSAAFEKWQAEAAEMKATKFAAGGAILLAAILVLSWRKMKQMRQSKSKYEATTATQSISSLYPESRVGDEEAPEPVADEEGPPVGHPLVHRLRLQLVDHLRREGRTRE